MGRDKSKSESELEAPVTRRGKRNDKKQSTKLMLAVLAVPVLLTVSVGSTVASWNDTEAGGLNLFGFNTCEAPRVEVDDSTWNYEATHPNGERLPNMPDFQIQGSETDATALRVEPAAPDDSFGGSGGGTTNREGAFENENSFLSLGEEGVTLTVSNPAESCGSVYVNSPAVGSSITNRQAGVFAAVIYDRTSENGVNTVEVRETHLYREARVQPRGSQADPNSPVTLIDGEPIEYGPDGAPTAEPDLILPNSGGGDDAFTWGSSEGENQNSVGGYYDTFRSIQVNDRADTENSGSRNQIGPARVENTAGVQFGAYRGSYSSARAMNNPANNDSNFGDAPIRGADFPESGSSTAVEFFFEDKSHSTQGFPGSTEGDHSGRLMQLPVTGGDLFNNWIRSEDSLFRERFWGNQEGEGVSTPRVSSPADTTWGEELTPEPVTVIEPGESKELTWNVDVSRDANGNRTDNVMSNRDGHPMYNGTWFTGYTVYFTDDPESTFHGAGSGMSRHGGEAPVLDDDTEGSPQALPETSEWEYYHIIEALVIEREASKVEVYNQEIAAYIEFVVNNNYNVEDARDAYAASLLNQFPGIPADTLNKYMDVIAELAGEIEEGEETLDLEQLTSMMPPSNLFSNFSAQISVDNAQSIQDALNNLRGVASSEFSVNSDLLTAELWNEYVNEHGVVQWILDRNPALDPDYEPEDPTDPTDPGEYTVQDMLDEMSAEALRNDTWGAVFYMNQAANYEEFESEIYAYLQNDYFPWMTNGLFNDYIQAVDLQGWFDEVHGGSEPGGPGDPGDLSAVETMIAKINERSNLVPGDFSSSFYQDSYTRSVVTNAENIDEAKVALRREELEGYYQVNIPSDQVYADFLVEIRFEAWYEELTGGGSGEPVDMQSIVDEITATDELVVGDFTSVFYENNAWIIDGQSISNSWMLMDFESELQVSYGVTFEDPNHFAAFRDFIQFEDWFNHVNGGGEPAEPANPQDFVNQINNRHAITVGDFNSEFYQQNSWIVNNATWGDSWMLADIRGEFEWTYNLEFSNDDDFDALLEFIEFEAWFNHVNGITAEPGDPEEPEEELSLLEEISAQDDLVPGDFDSNFYQTHSWLFYGQYSEWILEDFRGELGYYYGLTIENDEAWTEFLETIEFEDWYYEVTGYHPDPNHSSTWEAWRIASDAFGYESEIDFASNTYDALQAAYDSAETTQSAANEQFFTELLADTDFTVDDFNVDELQVLIDTIISGNGVEWVDPLVRNHPEDPAEWSSEQIAAYRAVENNNETAAEQVTADSENIDTELARGGNTTEEFYSQESTVYNELLVEFEEAGLDADQLDEYLTFIEREQLLAPNWSYDQLLNNVYWNFAFTDNSDNDIIERTAITTWGIEESDEDAMSTSLNDAVADIGWIEVFTPIRDFFETTLPGGFTEAQMDEFISEMTARNLEPESESNEITGGNNMSF